MLSDSKASWCSCHWHGWNGRWNSGCIGEWCKQSTKSQATWISGWHES